MSGLLTLGGTAKNALRLMQSGLNVVTLPKTIDNDVAETDVTFGFDSATAIATEAIDRLHSTASSRKRLMLVDIMGHNAGWLALSASRAESGRSPTAASSHLCSRTRSASIPADYVLAGHTRLDGRTPFNTGGGLVGYGPPDRRLGRAHGRRSLEAAEGEGREYQVRLDPKRPYGLLINMGGNDKTVVSAVFRAALRP